MATFWRRSSFGGSSVYPTLSTLEFPKLDHFLPKFIVFKVNCKELVLGPGRGTGSKLMNRGAAGQEGRLRTWEMEDRGGAGLLRKGDIPH